MFAEFSSVYHTTCPLRPQRLWTGTAAHAVDPETTLARLDSSAFQVSGPYKSIQQSLGQVGFELLKAGCN